MPQLRLSDDSVADRFAIWGLWKSHFHSDAGWGCMYRAAQMLMARSLLQHVVGDSWVRHAAVPFAARQHICTAIADAAPMQGAAHLGLPALAQLAHATQGIAPGTWIGPAAAAHLLQAAIASQVLVRGELPFAVHVAENGVLELPAVRAQATAALQHEPADTSPGAASAAAAEEPAAGASPASWKRALLVTVPLRLGMDSVDPLYIPALREILREPSCMGIIGGTPRHALYLYGTYGEDHVLYLDPHFTQPAAALACREAQAPRKSLSDSARRPGLGSPRKQRQGREAGAAAAPAAEAPAGSSLVSSAASWLVIPRMSSQPIARPEPCSCAATPVPPQASLSAMAAASGMRGPTLAKARAIFDRWPRAPPCVCVADSNLDSYHASARDMGMMPWQALDACLTVAFYVSSEDSLTQLEATLGRINASVPAQLFAVDISVRTPAPDLSDDEAAYRAGHTWTAVPSSGGAGPLPASPGTDADDDDGFVVL